MHERWALLLQQQLPLVNAQRLEEEEIRTLLVAENEMLRERIFALENAGGRSAPYPSSALASWRSGGACGNGLRVNPAASCTARPTSSRWVSFRRAR